MGRRRKDDDGDPAAEMTFQQAQTALELALAELQASDLDVEDMVRLHRLASRYAARCEEVLTAVEQDVMQWDPERPEEPPVPVQP